jgi:hypothetical protein
MTRLARIVLLTSVLILPLGGCASMNDFDPTDLIPGNLFGSKKKLPGDRKPVFPEGVPGVAQGIPQDLVKGHQPTQENGFAAEEPQSVASTQRQAAATTQQPEEFQPAPREKAKPKPKPKPKPKTAARQPERAPTSVTVRRPPKTQQQQHQEQPPQQQANGGGQWPDPQPKLRSSRPASGGAQWPDPPAAQQSATQSGGVQWPDPPPMR